MTDIMLTGDTFTVEYSKYCKRNMFDWLSRSIFLISRRIITPIFEQKFDEMLDCVSTSLVGSFNKCGSMLAVGCNDGRVAIWDIMNRILLRTINPHIFPVSSLSWNFFGDFICSGSFDKTCVVWNLLRDKFVKRFHFHSSIYKVQYRPKNGDHILVSLLNSPPLIINCLSEEYLQPLLKISQLLKEDNITDQDYQHGIASYDQSGSHIYYGSWKGSIIIVHADTFDLVNCVRVSGSVSPVKAIEFSISGKESCAFINQDRIIRLYHCEDMVCKDYILKSGSNSNDTIEEEIDNSTKKIEPIHKFQDLVNRTVWKKCCFSGDGDYFVGGSLRQCSMYIWDRNTGSLMIILNSVHGEVLMDMLWHPYRPIICTISGSVVSIWSQPKTENWSAYAPEFKELDENLEYIEKEGEFDLEDEDCDPPAQSDTNQNSYVDLVTKSRPMYLSDDEDLEDASKYLYMLPFALDRNEMHDNTTNLK